MVLEPVASFHSTSRGVIVANGGVVIFLFFWVVYKEVNIKNGSTRNVVCVDFVLVNWGIVMIVSNNVQPVINIPSRGHFFYEYLTFKLL